MNSKRLGDSSATCLHCGVTFDLSATSDTDGFCCSGCRVVHQTLKTLGLSDYYQMRGNSRSLHPGAESVPDSYRYADTPEFQKHYCQLLESNRRKMVLELEGIHCAACIWLLERLPQITSAVSEARVFFAESRIDITLSQEGACSQALHSIERLGYRVKPIPSQELLQAPGNLHQSSELIRIGITAVCALNSMMFAVSLYQGSYSGINPHHQALLEWYSLLLTVPSITYGALPFYRTSLGGLRAGILHIDLPIVFALVTGFIVSVMHTFEGKGGVYYDSITTVIFLLLSARYIQKHMILRFAGRQALASAVFPLKAVRLHPTKGREYALTQSLKKDEILVCSAGEQVAADGIVISGEGKISTAFLTGEPNPLPAGEGSPVFAGSQVLTGEFSLKITSTGSETRIGRLVRDVQEQEHQRPQIELFLDRRSKGFTALVLTGALGTALFWGQTNVILGIERMTALLLVACPCVLALATPIAFSIGMAQAARSGILIRKAEAIERLAKVRTILLDKTGTLTTGAMAVTGAWKIESDSVQHINLGNNSELSSDIWWMEHGIEHPIAQALRAYLLPHVHHSAITITEKQIVAGSGISARRTKDNTEIALGSPSWNRISEALPEHARNFIYDESSKGATAIVYQIKEAGGEMKHSVFIIGDQIKNGAPEALHRLKELGMSLQVISGDLHTTTEAVAASLGITASACHAPCTPEQKVNVVKASPKPNAMVGDGINDLSAFNYATASIGMAGGAESALRTADVYITGGDISLLPELFAGVRSVMKSVHRGLAISVLYNCLGALAAFLGYIGPLEAAVLMPLSSATSLTAIAAQRSFGRGSVRHDREKF